MQWAEKWKERSLPWWSQTPARWHQEHCQGCPFYWGPAPVFRWVRSSFECPTTIPDVILKYLSVYEHKLYYISFHFWTLVLLHTDLTVCWSWKCVSACFWLQPDNFVDRISVAVLDSRHLYWLAAFACVPISWKSSQRHILEVHKYKFAQFLFEMCFLLCIFMTIKLFIQCQSPLHIEHIWV